MTTALLVVNRKFIRNGNEYYSEGPRGPETGERYLRWFDRLIVAGREGVPVPNLDLGKLNRICEPGMDLVFLPNISGVKEMVLNRHKAREELRKLVRRVDCVVARNDGLGLLGAKVALEEGVPLAFDVGGCVLDGFRNHGSLVGRVYAPFAYRNTRRLIRRAPWVSYVTQEFLQNRYPPGDHARCVACSNVDIPLPDEVVLRHRLHRPAVNILRFGTIGSLHVQAKGVDDALIALASAAEGLPPFEYRVLGGGDPSSLRRLAFSLGIADRVHFDGTLASGTAVYDWLDRLDVYLHPSKREGLPRAVVEAMSRGCPVIASSVAGTPELLVASDMHPPGDVARLTALLRQAADAAWRSEAAERNWRRARDYSAPVLDARRDDFWGSFATSVQVRRAVATGQTNE